LAEVQCKLELKATQVVIPYSSSVSPKILQRSQECNSRKTNLKAALKWNFDRKNSKNVEDHRQAKIKAQRNR